MAVPGATEDSERIARMIRFDEPPVFSSKRGCRKNINEIGEIFVTLDSHHKKHIAHASFWSSREDDKEGISGIMPTPFHPILHKDVVDGKWFPRDCSLQAHCESYTNDLEQKGRFQLTIWPDHCLVGTVGHAIFGEIQSALRDWNVKHIKKTVKHIHKVHLHAPLLHTLINL